MTRPRRGSEDGFSLLELLTVLAITGVLAVIAGLQLEAARPAIKGDGGMRTVMAQMRLARERAITERRFMRMVFSPDNLVQVLREETTIPASTTEVASQVLEGTVEFRQLNAVPDTPDAFGAAAPISFGNAVNVKFTPDGALVDQNGNLVNGTVFLAIANQSVSVRAVTVQGSTGRIRAYRWNGRQWILV